MLSGSFSSAKWASLLKLHTPPPSPPLEGRGERRGEVLGEGRGERRGERRGAFCDFCDFRVTKAW